MDKVKNNLITLFSDFQNMTLSDFHDEKYVMKKHDIIKKNINNIYYKFYLYNKSYITNWPDNNLCRFYGITTKEHKIFKDVVKENENSD